VYSDRVGAVVIPFPHAARAPVARRRSVRFGAMAPRRVLHAVGGAMKAVVQAIVLALILAGLAANAAMLAVAFGVAF
jgi:hypothetical protein